MCQIKFSTSWWPDPRQSVLLLGLLLITSCGFQLRGTDLSSLGELNLSGVSGNTRISYVEHFESLGVAIADDRTEGLLVRFDSQRTQRRPVATSANISAAQYEVRFEVDFSVSRGKEIVIPLSTISAERIYSVDRFNLGGSFEEQVMLMNDIRGDLARQIVQRIESWYLEVSP